MTKGANLRIHEAKGREDSPVFILAHGAGAGSDHPWMVRFATALSARGVTTFTFDFPYVAACRKVPDPRNVLEAAYADVLRAAEARFGRRVAIGGKSMGGRIASQLAAKEDFDVAALVCFGYPLHPPGKPALRRDAHLARIRAPTLFVQGARDRFGDEAEITELAARMQATVHVVAMGDHSLAVPKKSGKTVAEVEAEALDVAARFLAAPARAG